MDRKQRILIIEDEKAIADILKFNLENEGFEIDISYNGEDGANKALSNKFDLILLWPFHPQ